MPKLFFLVASDSGGGKHIPEGEVPVTPLPAEGKYFRFKSIVRVDRAPVHDPCNYPLPEHCGFNPIASWSTAHVS